MKKYFTNIEKLPKVMTKENGSSILLLTMKMKIKTTFSFILHTPKKLAIFKKYNNSKIWQKIWHSHNTHILLVEIEKRRKIWKPIRHVLIM